MRQVTALVRRRGKFETCGEHHFCVGSPTGRRRFPQKEDSAGSNPSRRTNAHVDQRQESPPSKRGQCWFESNHGHQIRGRGGIGIRAGLKPRSLQVRSLSPAPTQKEDRHVDHAHAGSARNRSDQMRSRAFRRHQAHRHMWRRLKEDRNQHYENLRVRACSTQRQWRGSRNSPRNVLVSAAATSVICGAGIIRQCRSAGSCALP